MRIGAVARVASRRSADKFKTDLETNYEVAQRGWSPSLRCTPARGSASPTTRSRNSLQGATGGSAGSREPPVRRADTDQENDVDRGVVMLENARVTAHGIGAQRRPAPPIRQIRHNPALTAKLAPEHRQFPRELGRSRVAVSTRARGVTTIHIERGMRVSYLRNSRIGSPKNTCSRVREVGDTIRPPS